MEHVVTDADINRLIPDALGEDLDEEDFELGVIHHLDENTAQAVYDDSIVGDP